MEKVWIVIYAASAYMLGVNSTEISQIRNKKGIIVSIDSNNERNLKKPGKVTAAYVLKSSSHSKNNFYHNSGYHDAAGISPHKINALAEHRRNYSVGQVKSNPIRIIEDNFNNDDINYEFSYDVEAPEYKLVLGHAEKNYNQEVRGTYYVLLPDGRKQIVQYSAGRDGYKPIVSYQPTIAYTLSGGNDRSAILNTYPDINLKQFDSATITDKYLSHEDYRKLILKTMSANDKKYNLFNR